MLTLRDLLECTLYISEKLQDCINMVIPDNGSDMLGSAQSSHRSVRKHADRIIDLFLKKYVFNAIDLDRAEDSPDEQMSPDVLGQQANDSAGSLQMRGFELIMKVMEHVTLMDWLKIAQTKKGFHHKGQLIDLDINEKILSAVQALNENNLNTVALATNERSQLQGIIST